MELVLAAVDDGDGEAGTVLEEDHDGHGEDAVDLAGDGGELAAGVVGAGELDGEEQVGAEEGGLEISCREKVSSGGEIVTGELEEDVGGFPLSEEGFCGIEFRAAGLGLCKLEEGLWLGAFEDEGAIAVVAEGGEQGEGGLAQGLGGEVLEGGYDGLAEIGHGGGRGKN